MKKLMTSLLVAGTLLGAAATTNANAMTMSNGKKMNMTSSKSSSKMTMSGMKMHGSKAPKGLKMAKNAKFKTGTKIMVMADHMTGMKGAKGVVDGAYASKLYTVDFTNTKTHKEVTNHKYLVSQEIKGSHKVGSKITLEADHMTGMKGAKGKIVAISNGPAYMINYTPTNSKMEVTNHKWLAQSELMKMN